MYSTTYELKYEKRRTEDDPEIDMLYRMDLVQAFILDDLFYGKNEDNVEEDFDMEPFFKALNKKTDALYEKYKDNNILKDLLYRIKTKLRFPIDVNDMQSVFFFFFSYEYFYIFHKCICDLIQTNDISKLNYNKMVKKIEG